MAGFSANARNSVLVVNIGSFWGEIVFLIFWVMFLIELNICLTVIPARLPAAMLDPGSSLECRDVMVEIVSRVWGKNPDLDPDSDPNPDPDPVLDCDPDSDSKSDSDPNSNPDPNLISFLESLPNVVPGPEDELMLAGNAIFRPPGVLAI